MKRLVAAAALALCACQSVPESGLTINLKDGVAEWKNPKNTSIRGLNAGISDSGKAFIRADSITSTNDASVVQGVLDANVALSQNLLEALRAIAAMGAKAAAP